MRQKAKRAERTGALRYGWDLGDDGPRAKRSGNMTAFVPNQAEQAVIHQMQDWRAAGESLRAIARWFNDRGVPSKIGTGWSHVTVRATLDFAELVAV